MGETGYHQCDDQKRRSHVSTVSKVSEDVKKENKRGEREGAKKNST